MNKTRGQITLNIDGQSYQARLPINSLCALESVLDQEVTAAVQSFLINAQNKRLSIRHTRAFLWAMLLESRPSITLEEAGDLIDRATPAYVVKKIMEILPLTFPDPAKGGGESSGPPKPEELGTGSNTTTSG